MPRHRCHPGSAPRTPTFFLVVLLVPALGPACSQSRPDPSRQDVVLIVVDTLRADHLGVYGYDRPTSPHIDLLARGGVHFEAAWGAAPWTLPSVMSIMTSRYPSSHRVENDGLRLPDGIPTLAETLRARGYATGGFVSHIYVSRPFGFARGFETFEDFGLSEAGFRLEEGLEPTADRVTKAALEWVERQGSRPVFLFVHYFDPHWPYDPPARFQVLFPNPYEGPLDATYDSISRFQDPLVDLPGGYRQFLIDRYDAEIRFVDEQVGLLLDGMVGAGRGGRTRVVLTADHGEEFKDHGSMGHGRHLYEEVIRVPLVIGRVEPGRPTSSGRREDGPAAGLRDREESGAIATPVSGIDLFPTILALAGVAEAPSGLEGRSLADLSAPEQAVWEHLPEMARPLVSETIRLNAYRKAVRSGSLKLIRFMDENRTELYDLAVDPGELRDLSSERPDARHRLLRMLFSEVDLLSGAWNLRWSGDGNERRFQGWIRTEGIFRTVVPLFRERGKYVIERGNTLSFTDVGQAGESGLSFTTTPYEAAVTFYLMVDGQAQPRYTRLGGVGARPGVMPFTLEGKPSDGQAFIRPPHPRGEEVGYDLWRSRPADPGGAVTLDDEIRERLRSLGYVD